jgi:hypothetical protein
MKLPKSVTVLGVVMALAAVVIDPVNAPWITDLLGAQASAKLAAVGAMLAALGRAIFATTPPAPPAP